MRPGPSTENGRCPWRDFTSTNTLTHPPDWNGSSGGNSTGHTFEERKDVVLQGFEGLRLRMGERGGEPRRNRHEPTCCCEPPPPPCTLVPQDWCTRTRGIPPHQGFGGGGGTGGGVLGGGGGGAGGAAFLEAAKAAKKISGLNQLAQRQKRNFLIGQRPGGKIGPIF